MASEVLQIDEITAMFTGRRQRRDAERMHGDLGIKSNLLSVFLDQLFDGTDCE